MRRYLDVTKAQLFFAKGIILVEGITEALLVPELSKILSYSLEEHGISIVNIQSLAFSPFAKLFQDGAMSVPAALISDADPSSDIFPTNQQIDEISSTAKKLLEMESGSLKVFLASKTLEYNLALAGNAQRMAEEYQKLRSRKGSVMLEAVTSSQGLPEKAKSFWKHFDRQDKARFAQRLAESLSRKNDGFIVPPYIADAIKYVIEGLDEGTT